MCTTNLEVISSNLSRLIVSGATVKDYDKMLEKTFTTKWFASRGYEINGSSINEDNPRNKKLFFDILPAWQSTSQPTATTKSSQPIISVEERVNDNSGIILMGERDLNSPRYPSPELTKVKPRISRKTFCQDLAINVCDPEHTYYWILIWLVRFILGIVIVCALSYITVNVASKYVGEATTSAVQYIPSPVWSILNAVFPPSPSSTTPPAPTQQPIGTQPPPIIVKSTVEPPKRK